LGADSQVRGRKISRAAVTKIVAALLAITLLVLLAYRLPLMHWLALGAAWTHSQGMLGVLIGLGAIIVGSMLLAPLWALIILAGWLWHWWGLPISLGASTISAMLLFAIGRALGRSTVVQALRTSPRARKIFELAERGGPATVALMRVAPVIPFAPGNALLGLTRLQLRDMAIGTPLGLLPAGVFYVWMGSLLPDAHAIENGEVIHQLTEKKLTLLILFIAHVVVVAIAALIARRMHAKSERVETPAGD
jgi:uncharacterized membrane protein YdjX (TVP38/TMEM64 family)